MNNKLKGIFFTVLMIVIFFVGCVEDPMTTFYTEIINKSDYQVELKVYAVNNAKQLDLQLAVGEKYTESQSMHKSGDFYQFDLYSSVKVVYDDTLGVSYDSKDSLWYHNILINDSWIREHNDEYSYKYTYEFTNADYEYALEQQK